MLSILFYIIWIANIIFCILRKRSKILTLISIIFTILLFAGNTGNGDYLIYYREYNLNGMESFQLGFSMLAKICLFFHLSYNGFLLVVCLICYGLVFRYLKEYTMNFSCFFSLYFTILIFYDINQVRNFIVACILTIAIIKLSKGRKKEYLFLIILACFFHVIAIIYIPFVLINPENTSFPYLYKLLLVLVLGFCLIIFFNGNEIPLLTKFLKSFFEDTGLEDKTVYFMKKMRFGFLLTFTMDFFNIMLVSISKKIMKNNNYFCKNKKYEFLTNTVYAFNLLTICSFPLQMINHNFYRIFRNLNIINYFIASMTIDSFTYKNKDLYTRAYFMYILILFLYSIFWMVSIMYKYQAGNTQILMILHNNVIL